MIAVQAKFRGETWVIASMILACLLFASDLALSQTPFYEGKTIVLIQGRRPGGLGDMRVRATLSLLSDLIPGKPSIVAKYMPGGGGRKAANHLYRAAKPDGLTIANIGGGFVSNALLGARGVKYDVDKFTFLGSGNSRQSYAFATRAEAGFDTLEKLQAASGVRIGSQSIGHDIYIISRLFAWLLDLKSPRYVTGYSGPEIDIALMRGEVDTRANSATTLVRRTPEFIEKGLIDIQSIVEIPEGYRTKHPAFKKTPALQSFVRSDIERKVLGMYRTFRLIGSPYVLPPGVPEDRVRILKQAFTKFFKNPDLAKIWYKFTGEEAHPLLPDEQARAYRALPRDPEVIGVFKKIAGPEPLPARK